MENGNKVSLKKKGSKSIKILHVRMHKLKISQHSLSMYRGEGGVKQMAMVTYGLHLHEAKLYIISPLCLHLGPGYY